MRAAWSVVLLGLAGVGKSTVARALAERLDADLVDNDVVFVGEHEMTPRDYALRHGIDALRAEECRLLRITVAPSMTRRVIVAPGSALLLVEVDDLTSCAVALLTCDETVRQERFGSGRHRPTGSLEPTSSGAPLIRGRALARTIVDTTDVGPLEVVETLVRQLGLDR